MWNRQEKIRKSIDKECQALYDLRLTKTRHDDRLSKKQKQDKEVEAAHELEERRKFWVTRRKEDRLEETLQARSKKIIDSASSLVSDASKSFLSDSGNFNSYFLNIKLSLF